MKIKKCTEIPEGRNRPINEKSEKEKVIFMSDVPIISYKEDILDRTKFAQALGKTVLDLQDKKSIVLGLYGNWGVGKSSVINMILEHIRETSNIPEEKKPLVIEFTPWNFSEQNELISIFFNEIANKLRFADPYKKSKLIAKRLKLYGYFLSSATSISNTLRYIFSFFLFLLASLILGSSYFLKLVPFVKVVSIIFIGISIISALSSKVFFAMSDFFLEKSKFNEKTLKDLKDNLNSLILKRGKRLIIVIDDIDRLNQKEIKQILQLVKINADFPNTLYLLAFERGIIEQNLQEQKGVSGKEYLEKIVQVDFDIPAIQKNKLYNFLFRQLDAIIKPVPEHLWEDTRWGNLFHAGLKNLFNSLRDVKRFINSLSFTFLLIRKEGSFELNPIDFIGLEAIRVFVPEVYKAMKDKNRLFTTTNSYASQHSDDSEKTRRREIENIINKTNDPIKESVKNIIFQLFPQVEGLFTNMHYGSNFQSDWNKTGRICSTEMFDRYFILEVPEGEIAQFEIDKILDSTKNKNQFTQELEKYLKDKRLRKLLDKLEDYTNNFDLRFARNIIAPLLDITDKLPEEKVGVFDIGCDMRIMRIIYHYLKRIKDNKRRSSILKEAIKNSKGLYGCVLRVSIETAGIEKKSESKRIILENQIDEFKKLCVAKIKEFHQKNKLKDLPDLVYILFRWREWGNPEEVQSFIDGLIKSDKDLIILIKNFLTEHSRYTIGDYVGKIKWVMDYKNLEKFVDLDAAKKRLEKIDLNELHNKERLTVETFLKKFDSNDNSNTNVLN